MEATATPAFTTLPPPSSQTSHWCTPPTPSTPSTRALCHLACPRSRIPSTHMGSCSPTTPCLTPVTGSPPGVPAINDSPHQRSSWPTSAHTPSCLWEWTVSCSLDPPLDPHPATFTFPTRAAQAPCRAPSPSELPPAWD